MTPSSLTPELVDVTTPAIHAGEQARTKAENGADERTDLLITHWVESKLKAIMDREALSIHATTDHGVVHLTGRVDSLLDKMVAERIARYGPAVRAVVNDLLSDE